MASINPMLTDHEGGGALRFGRVEPDTRRVALAMLLTGRAHSKDPAVDQFLNFTHAQGLILDELWAAWRGSTVLASALIVPSAGHTAMLFVSPISAANGNLQSELVRAACTGQGSADLRLIQCLLDPSQRSEQQSLIEAGFESLATLVYMHRRGLKPQESARLNDQDLTILTWSESRRGLFAEVILASYQETLDCPGLLGLRPIDDVINGHQATGIFNPKTWFAFYRGDEPVGVMLLSEIAHRGAFELVYLGLAPSFRGAGLASRILQFGLDVAHDCGATNMLLAVDEQNTPALRLYRKHGFQPTGRKAALIYTLKPRSRK